MFNANIEFGLTEAQILKSAAENGRNLLTAKKRKSFVKSLLGNFGDPMIKILLIALGINIVMLFVNFSSSGKISFFDFIEPMGIAFAVLVAVIVSTVSEYGSEAAFEKLQTEAMNITCRVRREGRVMVIPITEIVTGDIVLLSTGDKIPADGIIMSGNLDVDQSALNGESKEANKSPLSVQRVKLKSDKILISTIQETVDFLDPSLLFSGTVVTGGQGVMRVTAVGEKAFYGRLATGLLEEPPESPLKTKLRTLAKKISKFGYIGAGLVALSYLFSTIFIKNGFDGAAIKAMLTDYRQVIKLVLNTVTLSVTLIVMAVPEGLPMMITVVLSSNMRRMLKDNVLVRKLSGIETAGSMNILFTDKTGTLTVGKPEVINIVMGDGALHNPENFIDNGVFSDILSLSLTYNNGAEMSDGIAVGGNLTDRALLNYAHKIPYKPFGINRGAVIPFSSTGKFMATEIRFSSTVSATRFNLTDNITLIKGAPEKILEHCSKYYDKSGRLVPFNDRRKINRMIDELGGRAIRVLAAAISVEKIEKDKPFKELILVGLIGIRDCIRKEAITGVREVCGAGIQTVMITGDAKNTAVAVATETGILKDGGLVLTSDEMAKLSDAELALKLRELRVVARALPDDKSRLVRIAQSMNLVAGMTGDGVNDAPALKKADIGFAMGSGTEVAKEAGDVVILDDNIMSVARAVSYGRTIFKSIRKFIIFQLTINVCAMAVSLIAPLFNIETPITVMQILWINLIMDTLAGLAFGGERPRKKYMLEPPKRRDEPIVNKYMFNQIVVTSIYMSLLSLWFLKSGIISPVGQAADHTYYKLTAFFALFMFAAIFNSLNARTHEINLTDHIAVNKQFIWIMGAVSVIQLLMIYFGGALFRTEALSLKHFISILFLAFTVVPVDIIRKIILRRKESGGT